ncbi:NAD(P)/FAD-dependent oxidoreductase [Candidatus Woesearchaeota archaeon]|nr:NAD(P)/FAD-dependent oxidoreductase [Candidatus Woesearchaeota archaeon]
MNERINKKDVCIIGAGPVGCYTASELAKKGFNVEVFEEHAEIGKPIACTGLVTESIKEIMQIKKEFLVNEIKHAEIFCGNTSVRIKLNEYVLDRYKFDNYLAESAKDNGAKIFTCHRFVGVDKNEILIKPLNRRLKFNEDNVDGNVKRKMSGDVEKNAKKNAEKEIMRIKTQHLIGSDGPSSLVGKIINPEKRLKYYIGKQMLLKGNFEKDTIKIYLGDICPNFFGWVVPESEEVARVGVASEQPNQYFEMFVNDLMKKNIVNEKISLQAGPIPFFDSDYRVYKPLTAKITEKENNNLTNNLTKDSQSANAYYYIVGDAAGHVKATTGGGLVPGLRCAKILAESVAEGNNYEEEIRKVKRELKMHLMLRNLLNKFSEKDYLELLQLLDKECVKNVLEKHSRDSSIKLLTKLFFSEPRLAKFVLKMIW